jgi:hypothetical protein
MKTVDSLRFFGEMTDFHSDFSQRTRTNGSLSPKQFKSGVGNSTIFQIIAQQWLLPTSLAVTCPDFCFVFTIFSCLA